MSEDTRTEDRGLIEAALFLSPEPLTRRRLAKIIGGTSLAYVDRILEEIKAEFDAPTHGIELLIEDGRAFLQVKRPYVDRVAHLAPQQDIPRPVLRTLAMIAYNNPLTQADLIKVRGNKAYGHVTELLERGLIRAEPQGRTLLLSVTDEFLRYFGLTNVEEFRFHVGAVREELEIDKEEPEEPTEETGEKEVE